MKSLPYRVELDCDGCSQCCEGRSWMVVGPDDVAHSTSFTDEEDAEALAAALNTAYAHGAGSADAALAVLRGLEWIGMNDGRGVTHLQCPACSALKSRGTGHNPYCGLEAALSSASRSPEGRKPEHRCGVHGFWQHAYETGEQCPGCVADGRVEGRQDTPQLTEHKD